MWAIWTSSQKIKTPSEGRRPCTEGNKTPCHPRSVQRTLSSQWERFMAEKRPEFERSPYSQLASRKIVLYSSHAAGLQFYSFTVAEQARVVSVGKTAMWPRLLRHWRPSNDCFKWIKILFSSLSSLHSHEKVIFTGPSAVMWKTKYKPWLSRSLQTTT